MSEIGKKLYEIDKLNQLQQRDQWMNHLHPLVKFALNTFYLLVVVSVGKYQLQIMLLLAVYPLVSYNLADLNVGGALHRMRMILPLVLCVGVFNPFLDRGVIMQVGGVGISGGIISMITLMLKGIYTVLCAYLLIATTSVEEICYALRLCHVPKLLVTVLLLTYRYIQILGEEAERIMNAYRLRAPSQRGIHYKAWGSLVGQWLLRSMDKAQRVYESMLLRGYRGDFFAEKTHEGTAGGIGYGIIWVIVLLVLRSRIWTIIIG